MYALMARIHVFSPKYRIPSLFVSFCVGQSDRYSYLDDALAPRLSAIVNSKLFWPIFKPVYGDTRKKAVDSNSGLLDTAFVALPRELPPLPSAQWPNVFRKPVILLVRSRELGFEYRLKVSTTQSNVLKL